MSDSSTGSVNTFTVGAPSGRDSVGADSLFNREPDIGAGFGSESSFSSKLSRASDQHRIDNDRFDRAATDTSVRKSRQNTNHNSSATDRRSGQVNETDNSAKAKSVRQTNDTNNSSKPDSRVQSPGEASKAESVASDGATKTQESAVEASESLTSRAADLVSINEVVTQQNATTTDTQITLVGQAGAQNADDSLVDTGTANSASGDEIADSATLLNSVDLGETVQNAGSTLNGELGRTLPGLSAEVTADASSVSEPVASQSAIVASSEPGVGEPVVPSFKVGELVSSSTLANRSRQIAYGVEVSAQAASAAEPELMTAVDAPTMSDASLVAEQPLAASYLGASGSGINGFLPAGLRDRIELTSTGLTQSGLSMNGLSGATGVDANVELGINGALELTDLDDITVNELYEEISLDTATTMKNAAQNAISMIKGEGEVSVDSELSVNNMFRTDFGGTVTAPTLARTDVSASAVANAPVTVPILTPAADDALAGNVRWMVGEGIQNASVSLSPSGMGPISIQIGIENEQMNVSITATQGTTREALEALLPRLREQLLSQGYDGVRVDVSEGRSEQSRGNNGQQQFGNGQNPLGDNPQGADNNQQGGQTDANGGAVDTRVGGSGERLMSEAERQLVTQLQRFSPDTPVNNSQAMYGYDLYV